MSTPNKLDRTLMLWNLILVTLIGAATLANAQEKSGSLGPEQVIREFYKWYVPLLDDGGDVFETKREELKRYVTDRFLREIEKARNDEELSSDPFWKRRILTKPGRRTSPSRR